MSRRIKDILEDTDNEILYSQISLLEIAIKYQTGKLPQFDISLQAFHDTLQQKGFAFLFVTNEHLFAYFNSVYFSEEHRDPFDRCLITMADIEKASFITKDEKFELYKERINMVW